MKAMVYTQYGSPEVLSLQQVEKPSPKDNEVLVKIRAVSLNVADKHLLQGPLLVRPTQGMFGPKRRILGADIAGQVEIVGKSVKQFKPGDEVFVDLSNNGLGGFADYVCVPEDVLVYKPANLNFEQAAAVPMAAVTALQGLYQGKIQAGQTVLINGASGGVGTFAVQIAKTLGATVTAVCSSSKVTQARDLGGDEVIDYTKQDITKTKQKYDLILDVAAYRSPSIYKSILKPQGRYVMAGGSISSFMRLMLQASFLSKGGQHFSVLMAKPNAKDLSFIKELVEADKVKPVIEKV